MELNSMRKTAGTIAQATNPKSCASKAPKLCGGESATKPASMSEHCKLVRSARFETLRLVLRIKSTNEHTENRNVSAKRTRGSKAAFERLLASSHVAKNGAAALM